jgi:hypothetical protein
MPHAPSFPLRHVSARPLLAVIALAGAVLAGCGDSAGRAPADAAVRGADTVPPTVRVATFNIFELGVTKLDARDANGTPVDSQLLAAAEIIKAYRPDVLLLNEIDAVPGEPARVARRFVAEFLATGEDSITYPYVWAGETNTGELSGFDLDRDGTVATAAEEGTRPHGNDSWGYGTYPGQYGMAVLSRYPLDTAAIRTFRRFRWRDLPGAHIPPGWYTDEVLEQFRLSSKSHWDVPVIIGGDTLHLLASHPTPPGFDGDEDRNGRRNHDEIGFWAYYLLGDSAIYDDADVRGGLPADAPFVIAGDLNADPTPGDGPLYGGMPAIMQLLRHPRVQDPAPLTGRPTAPFRGGIRIDYVLPSKDLTVRDGGVAWPDSLEDPAGAARAALASDHRLVWVDLALPLRQASADALPD